MKSGRTPASGRAAGPRLVRAGEDGHGMRLSPPVRAAAQRLALPMLVFVAGVLTVLGKADILLIDRLRVAVADAMAPVLELMAAAARRGDRRGRQGRGRGRRLSPRTRRLREENQRLLQWQEVARRLAAENAELRDLDKLVPDQARPCICGAGHRRFGRRLPAQRAGRCRRARRRRARPGGARPARASSAASPRSASARRASCCSPISTRTSR